MSKTKRWLRGVVAVLALGVTGTVGTGCSPEVGELEAPAGDSYNPEELLAEIEEAITSYTNTGLHTTSSNWEFELAPNYDLICINKGATSSGRTEVHVLSAASNYKQFIVHATTPLSTTNSSWNFSLDANRNVYGILRQGVTGMVELHELTAASNYAAFGLRVATAQSGLPSGTFEFETAPNGDLFIIHKQGGASNRTELHVLSRASNYQSFTVHAATPLAYTDGNWDFEVDASRNLWGVLKGPTTGSGKTEVHIMSPSSNYTVFRHQSATELRVTSSPWVFDVAPNCQLGGIKRWGGSTTELHLVDPTPAFAVSGRCP